MTQRISIQKQSSNEWIVIDPDSVTVYGTFDNEKEAILFARKLKKKMNPDDNK